MRAILVVLDGLGDRGIPEFGGKTPLQAARTPHMDAVAASGITGLYHSTCQGMAMPSEMAHFVLFGYHLKDFPGRGYIEAVGRGLPVGPEDVAFLARMFHVKPRGEEYLLLHEKVPVGAADFARLCQGVSPFSTGGYTLSLYPSGGNGAIALLRGGASPEVTDSNPILEGRSIMEVLPLEGAGDMERARKTAAWCNHYTLETHTILEGHPINRQRRASGEIPLNMVTFQRPGAFRELPSFRHAWGLRGLCIASGALYFGLCSTLGMEVLPVTDTGDWGADLLERLQKAHRAKEYDFIYVHTKAPDEMAHLGDPEKKRDVIEALDKAFAWAVKEIIPDEEVVFVLTSDHSTPSGGEMIHSGEPVPLAITGRYARRDAVGHFDEIRCASGALGMVRGHEVMYMILNLLDRGKLQGLMDSPTNQPYFPGPYQSLRRQR